MVKEYRVYCHFSGSKYEDNGSPDKVYTVRARSAEAAEWKVDAATQREYEVLEAEECEPL